MLLGRRQRLIAVIGAVLCAVALADDAAVEHNERQVDRAALLAQQQAVAKLAALAKKHQGTFREPILLMRLTEAQQQAADFEFRIAHGESEHKKKPINLTRYQFRLQDIITSTSTIIEKYPKTEG